MTLENMKRLLEKFKILVFKLCTLYITKYCTKREIKYPFIEFNFGNIQYVSAKIYVPQTETDIINKNRIEYSTKYCKSLLYEALDEHINVMVSHSESSNPSSAHITCYIKALKEK